MVLIASGFGDDYLIKMAAYGLPQCVVRTKLDSQTKRAGNLAFALIWAGHAGVGRMQQTLVEFCKSRGLDGIADWWRVRMLGRSSCGDWFAK